MSHVLKLSLRCPLISHSKHINNTILAGKAEPHVHPPPAGRDSLLQAAPVSV